MYRAEGNANLILALPETRQVLRLKKVAKEDPAVDANENFLMLKSVVRYIRRISALFHQDFVTSPRLVILLSLRDMDAFNKQLNQYRPVDRLSKEIRFPLGIIYPDVTFLPPCLTTSETEPVFCVEIKPKQGWRFNETPADERQFQKLFDLDDHSLATCRYCAMQHLKHKKGKIKALSRYCPIDLFSGDPMRMRQAIRNLIDCPQNNLRIFRNGDQVYGDQQYLNQDRLHNILAEIFGSRDRQRNLLHFTQLLCSILLKVYSPSDNAQRGNLPGGCVLAQILSVQRNVHAFFASLDLGDAQLNHCDITQRVTEELLRGNSFQRYQFGATALDCSLMVTFQRTGDDPQPLSERFLVQLEGHSAHFMTKIAVMDLDPKPFTHAAKYVEQSQQSFYYRKQSQNQRQSLL